jgi:uncharacterized membrane protein
VKLDSITSRFGATPLERVLGIIGFIAWAVAVPSLLLSPERITFKIAWAVALIAIVGWNVLVFTRRRRTGAGPG